MFDKPFLPRSPGTIFRSGDGQLSLINSVRGNTFRYTPQRMDDKMSIRKTLLDFFAYAFTWTILLAAIGCQASVAEVSDRDVLETELVQRIMHMEQFSSEPIIHHLLVDESNPETIFLVLTPEHNRYVFVLETKQHGDVTTYKIVYRAVINSGPVEKSSNYMFPSEARLVDLDKNGNNELLVELNSLAADRVIQGLLVIARKDGEWRGFVSPPVAPVIREQIGNVGLYAEDFKHAVTFDGKGHYMQPISKGGEWDVIFDRTSGRRGILATVTLNEGESNAAAHRRALIMYRFTNDGFRQDADWNGGRAYSTQKPMSFRAFKNLKENLIKTGFADAKSF